MNELTLSERIMLDKLNVINIRLEKDKIQSLWNVCWGYLNDKFKEDLISESEQKIKKVLKKVNSLAPRIVISNCADVFQYGDGKITLRKEDKVQKIVGDTKRNKNMLF